MVPRDAIATGDWDRIAGAPAAPGGRRGRAWHDRDVILGLRAAGDVPVRRGVARRSHAAPRPRRGPHPHRPRVHGLGRRRRIQRRPRPAPVLRPAHRRRSPPSSTTRSAACVEDFILQGGVDTVFIKWGADDGIGRTVRNGLNFTERGFGVRGAVGVLRSRQHRRRAAQARRCRLGPPLRQARRALVPHRRHLRRAVRNHRGRRRRGGEGGQEARHDRLLRPQLPPVALEEHRRPGNGRSEVNREIANYVDVMIGNEEDFTASLGFEVPGADADLQRPRRPPTSRR